MSRIDNSADESRRAFIRKAGRAAVAAPAAALLINAAAQQAKAAQVVCASLAPIACDD